MSANRRIWADTGTMAIVGVFEGGYDDAHRERRRSDLDAGQTVVLEAQRADDGLKVNHRGNVPAGALHFVAFKPGRSSCHDVSVLSDGMALHHLHTRAHLTALSSMSTTRSMRR